MGAKVTYTYCPQCRRPFDHDAEGLPYCAACDITIYTNVATGAAVAPVRDGRVLLVRRAREPFKGTYDLLGGFMMPGETPEEAAIRETKEESGLDVKITGLLGYYADSYGDDGTATLGVHFIGEITGGHEQAADDAGALEWVDIDSLPAEAFTRGFKNTRESLQDLQAWFRDQPKR